MANYHWVETTLKIDENIVDELLNNFNKNYLFDLFRIEKYNDDFYQTTWTLYPKESDTLSNKDMNHLNEINIWLNDEGYIESKHSTLNGIIYYLSCILTRYLYDVLPNSNAYDEGIDYYIPTDMLSEYDGYKSFKREGGNFYYNKNKMKSLKVFEENYNRLAIRNHKIDEILKSN